MDLETTDLPPARCEVIYLGALHADRLEIRVRPREVKAGAFYNALRRPHR